MAVYTRQEDDQTETCLEATARLSRDLTGVAGICHRATSVASLTVTCSAAMDSPTTASHLGVRDRWLTTGLLGIGLIVLALEASVSNYTLPKIMTSLRVELYSIH